MSCETPHALGPHSPLHPSSGRGKRVCSGHGTRSGIWPEYNHTALLNCKGSQEMCFQKAKETGFAEPTRVLDPLVAHPDI